ncbi:unnamed protein product [Pedinophyceae sp. YPF-701]|nr:unnamed protein product [Pedinophyceae sp. YPF-701]
MAAPAIQRLNQRAEVIGRAGALHMNINAAKGLSDVLRQNLGPKGSLHMLVGGAGDIKLTKDGNVLLREMQIQNPTAVMIARTATAQDDVCGDGTTTTVCFIGELMKQAERLISEGVHPRVIVDGFEAAKRESLMFLETFKQGLTGADRETLVCVVRTALRTKLAEEMADRLTESVVDALLMIRQEGEPLDLNMVEVMHMRHKLDSDTRLVRGLVLDHGARHPDMKKRVEKAHILSCNISLEYEKTEVNSGFFYTSAEQRERLVEAERKVTDDRVRAVIDLKRRVCKDGEGFVVINQKGIDPLSLDMLAKEGILALRRAKKRNAERLALCCGGYMVNAVEELSEECLGYAGEVYEHVLGEEKYTFVEEVKNPRSCTILIKGPNDYTIAQIKDAIRDGLRAAKNAIDDGAVVPGAAAFEVACALHLLGEGKNRTEGKAKLGVEAFAHALLGIPKILADNSGHDAQEAVISLQEEHKSGNPAGLDLESGTPCDPSTIGVYDNYTVKKQILNSAPVMACQLLLVDEVIRAGINMRRK